MKLPDKILHGDSYADIKRKINQIVDFVRAQQPVAGRGVRIRHYTSGTIFEASGSGARQSSAEGYDGFFAVSLVRDENEASVIRIADGSDPESQTAGIAYVNGKAVEFPVAELSPSEGWLCLKTDGTEHSYEILDAPGDLIDTEAEISYHLLAQITGSGDSTNVRQVLKYAVPQLWIAGECEENE